MTQICVFNTRLVSTHYTLLSATPQGGMFPEVFKETQYKSRFKWFKPWEHVFKQLAIQHDILVTGCGKKCLVFYTMQYIKFAHMFHRNVPPPNLA